MSVSSAGRSGKEQALPRLREPALEVVGLPVAIGGKEQEELG